MLKKKFMFSCDICGDQYQHGPNLYEGHRLELYGDIFCCDICWQGNWDGWAPHHEAVILKNLKEKKLPIPARNEQGFLPRN